MLRIKLLRNLLLLSLAIALVLPGYDFFFLHPAYHEHLIEETEGLAVRYAGYMLRSLGLEGQVLSRDRLPEGLEQSLQPAGGDERLLKMRIFSPRGEILYSTESAEIGDINTSSYFHDIVATGRVYSKVVNKDSQTADGVVARVELVETYVPLMSGDAFGGAIEIYYDITGNAARFERLSFSSMLITLVMSVGFLLSVWYALYRVHVSLQEREATQQILQKANEDLEQRVAERTLEFTDANFQLTNQIAERIQAQTALRHALGEIQVDREKLEGILRSVPDGVVVTDSGLNILHMNAAAEALLGMTLEEVCGRSVASLSGNVDFVRKIRQRLDLVQMTRPFDFELQHAQDQNPRVYQVRISQFVPDETNSPGVVLLIRDVTRERDVERMKSAFLGMAAHELNTPLTTIVGFTELLTARETADSFSQEQQREFLHLIHAKALALGGLIDDLLDISRVESGRPLTLNYQEFSFSGLLGDIVAAYRDRFAGHQFEISLPDAPALLCADLARLKQAIDHLVSNAVKYSPEGGAVRLALALHDDSYELRVEDEGIGMSDDQLAHVFDRFYRVDSSDTAVQGAGLGMSIVRHIVQAHHGEIQVTSRLGSGTSVRVDLPRTPSAEQLDAHCPFAS